jgi:colanic acid biosynthesis glycosyl transferase WcaI
MKTKILLIGYNFYPEPTGIGKYSGEMIQWLAKNGYDCTVITTYPYYPHWKVQEPYIKDRFLYTTEIQNFESGGRITICRCPMYVPANPSGFKRILLDFSFTLSAFVKLINLYPNNYFNHVITVAPSFQFGLLGILSKKAWKSKFTYHIQDMQIEAAKDLKMIKSKMIINTLFKLEKTIFNNSDFISSISDSMTKRIEEKAKKPVILFPNWTDNAYFYPIANKEKLKVEFGFRPTDRIVLYSGAIGEKQGLEAIIYAAKHFADRKNIRFVICGSGPYKVYLQNLANSINADNVIFLPLQPSEKFNHFLNLADIHLVIQRANASDLVMPSKLTTILSVGGLALVTANPGSGLYELINKYDIGLLIDAENQLALNAGIQKALTEDNINIALNARTYAEKYLSINSIMKSFEETVLCS